MAWPPGGAADAFPVFGSDGGRSPLRGWCGRIAAFFHLGSSTGGGGLHFGIVILGCLGGVLVVRMIPLDGFFVPLGRFLGLEGVQ